MAKRDLKKGHLITYNDIVLKKPGLGIEPDQFDDVIGCKVLVNIELDSCITWSQLEKP